jgi:hypothetical protein
MPNNPLGLNRDQLAKALGNQYPVIRAFEQLQFDAASTPTTIEEATAIANTAFAAATQAYDVVLSLVQALEALDAAPAAVADPVEEQYIPASFLPTLGTLAEQDANAVAITGGRVGLDAGTVAAPSLYLGGDGSTGLYRIGANNWGLAVSGVKTIDYKSTRIDYSVDSLYAIGKSTHYFNLQYGIGTPDSSGLQVFAAVGDSLRFGQRAGDLSFTEAGRFLPDGGFRANFKFGCNSATPQAPAALGAAATDLPTAIALVNNIRLALIANGIGS